MLGRAFINDPPLKVVLPDVTDPSVRALHLADFFRVIFTIQRRGGQPVFGVVLDGKVVAAAITEGAGHGSMTSTILAGMADMPRMVRAIGWGGTFRGINLLSVLASNHPPEPHIYLNFLGVEPAYQKSHFGTALLDHLRALASTRSDLAGVYLETATEANVAYYTARGYRVLSEIFPLGCRMWRMFQTIRA